jgi:Cu(I)/Ag(I) efflux system membrane protein CusA/SilA
MNEQSYKPDFGSLLERAIWFCIEKKIIVVLGILLVMCWGILVAPFDWDLGGLPRYPVPVDAIPDIGENQQIVFTEWSGRSPRDVEDQITYPLTAALLVSVIGGLTTLSTCESLRKHK